MTSNPKPHVDRCDKCGETTTDLDAGFCPSLHGMGHGCGGTWRRRAGELCPHCGQPASDIGPATCPAHLL